MDIDGGGTYLNYASETQIIDCPVNNTKLIELSKEDESVEYVSAPTQSLLARWLREKHDINVNSYRTWAMDNSYNYEILVGTDFDGMVRQYSEPGRSFEKSMEEGLQKALNLLEKEETK